MTAPNDDENAVVTSTPGIGYRLQQARERKKLTIAEVATQLRFTRATVIHLEQEEWDKLHSRTYARGYLLNYLKFLGLPSDDMLSTFNAQYGDAERPTNLLVTKTLPDDRAFPWLSSLLIVTVLMIAAVAYQYWPQQDFDAAPQSDSTIINSDDYQSPAAQTAPDADLLENDSGIQPNPVNAQDTRDVSKLNELPAIPLMIESMPAEMADSEQQNLTTPAAEIAEINAAETAVSADEVPAEVTATVTDGEARLTLEITEASWVEVKDDAGNTLISRVLEQETVGLTGPAPLAVRIGNVAGTTLRYNDAIVDLDAYRRNNVARLTLGDD